MPASAPLPARQLAQPNRNSGAASYGAGSRRPSQRHSSRPSRRLSSTASHSRVTHRDVVSAAPKRDRLALGRRGWVASHRAGGSEQRPRVAASSPLWPVDQRPLLPRRKFSGNGGDEAGPLAVRARRQERSQRVPVGQRYQARERRRRGHGGALGRWDLVPVGRAAERVGADEGTPSPGRDQQDVQQFAAARRCYTGEHPNFAAPALRISAGRRLSNQHGDHLDGAAAAHRRHRLGSHRRLTQVGEVDARSDDELAPVQPDQHQALVRMEAQQVGDRMHDVGRAAQPQVPAPESGRLLGTAAQIRPQQRGRGTESGGCGRQSQPVDAPGVGRS